MRLARLGDMVAQAREVTGELKELNKLHKYVSGKIVKTE